MPLHPQIIEVPEVETPIMCNDGDLNSVQHIKTETKFKRTYTKFIKTTECLYSLMD